MRQVKVKVMGRTPLLCNRFTDEAAMTATAGTSTVGTGDRGTPREQAEKCLYTSVDGKTLVIPGPNFYRCIIDAGKFFKNGKSKVTTQKSSLIPACVELEELELPIEHKEPWEVFSYPVRIPSTGGRIIRHRAMFNDWILSFTLNVDTDIIAMELMRDIMDAAGRRIGLGDFRPDCKGPYGKFLVTLWKLGKVKVG